MGIDCGSGGWGVYTSTQNDYMWPSHSDEKFDGSKARVSMTNRF